MRAILIDPEAKTIEETDYNGDFKHIHKLIGCDTFTVVNLDFWEDGNTEGIFVDDEGLLNDPRYFFVWKEYHQPLAGKGLILGCDPEGNSVATALPLEYVRSMVSFTELSMEGFVEEEGTTTLYGTEMPYIRQTPVFGPPKKED